MKIRSIFTSVDGEINDFHQGRLSVFVRLAGCNLNCSYCDTKYAQSIKAGTEKSISEIVSNVCKFNLDKVTITGGEPLLQADEVKILIKELSTKGKKITIETNGSINTDGYFPSRMVVDYKLPSSGMEHEMKVKAFSLLTVGDVIKFVISDYKDFQRALQIHDLFSSLGIIFAYSPVLTKNGDLGQSARLLEWMLTEPRKSMVLNVQLHKIINLKEPE